jgi:hypothetical protein
MGDGDAMLRPIVVIEWVPGDVGCICESRSFFPLRWYPQLLVIIRDFLLHRIEEPSRDMGGGGWIWGYKRGLDMYVPCMELGRATANPHVSLVTYYLLAAVLDLGSYRNL